MNPPPFAHAHASHPDWRMAFGLVAAQLEAQLAGAPAPTLGWCYLTDHHAVHAEPLLAALRERWPATAWVGTVGVGVCASGVEYFDEPALAVMLGHLPREQFRVYSGRRPLPAHDGFAAHTALVHADPATPELGALIGELADRTGGHYLFGGLASSRGRCVMLADAVYEGGLSGVAFTAEAALVSRVTQGCQPLGPLRHIGEVERNVVYTLDGRPALDVLLADLGVSEQEPREAMARLRGTLVGLSDAEEAAPFGLPAQNPEFATPARRGSFGTETRVRHLIGIDPQRRGLAIADTPEPGQLLAFCRRDTDAARRDLVRIATEVRGALEPEDLPLVTPSPAYAALAMQARAAAAAATTQGRRMLGALYFSCTGRGGPHFGAPSAELQLLRHALGEVPLVGFFAAGEIGHRHLYGYTGVLTVFTAPA
ncbi:MAG TPA: FIST N-terminal domain-containing protein [Methylibium sp.]|nr:FIST N-terminal domain-containing protein [Methylibium sp.]